MGFLRSKHQHIQRDRVREAARRVDGVAVRLRRRDTIRRREYRVPRPLALWHGDGYHKLIPYGLGLSMGIPEWLCRPHLPTHHAYTV